MLYVFSDLLIFCDEPTKSDLHHQRAILTLRIEIIQMFRAFKATGLYFLSVFVEYLEI